MRAGRCLHFGKEKVSRKLHRSRGADEIGNLRIIHGGQNAW